jgi:hypothetical protein
VNPHENPRKASSSIGFAGEFQTAFVPSSFALPGPDGVREKV